MRNFCYSASIAKKEKKKKRKKEKKRMNGAEK
jgi:hypothetical protein